MGAFEFGICDSSSTEQHADELRWAESFRGLIATRLHRADLELEQSSKITLGEKLGGYGDILGHPCQGIKPGSSHTAAFRPTIVAAE